MSLPRLGGWHWSVYPPGHAAGKGFGATIVLEVKYHVAWITKYRKPVLTREMQIRLRELIRQTCTTMDVRIESGHVARDHIHLLVSVPPYISVSQLMKRIKATHPEMPVIVITGYGTFNTEKQVLANGADGYIPKPCTINRVQETVNAALGVA